MKIFIVGQSNVGKSYLFNQLCNRSIAITQNENNTTVDIISCTMGENIIYDTPGMQSTTLYPADLFLYKIRDSGIEEFDQKVLKQIYQANIPVILVAKNLEKLPSIEKYLSDDVFALQKRLNLTQETKSLKPIVAIIGRENSGKSTLMNSIVGFERCKVSEIAGTTKDSIVEEGRDFCFVDTAGYCKEKSYMQRLIAEKRKEVLKESNGVILLLDGSKPITKMEKQLIRECKTYSNFCIAAINKKDISTLESKTSFDYFSFGNFPIVEISAKNNQIKSLMFHLKRSYRNSQKTISTPKINSWLNKNDFKLLDENNNLVKIKYLIQIGINPTRFRYFSSKKISEKHEKFLVRSIVRDFQLEGVNIGISFCSK